MTDSSEWTGRVGDVWAEEWRRTDSSFADLARHLDAAILAVAPHRGQALDIGSGAGATSVALARARPDLAITGLDLSQGLVAVARERAGGLPNLRFEVGDAAAPPPARGSGYDLAFSRHGVMFFADPVTAFAAIRARLAPGAPLVFSCFQPVARNPWASEIAGAVGGAVATTDYAPGPFTFADPEFATHVLTGAGWRDASATAIDYCYRVGDGDDPVGESTAFFRRIGPAARVLAGLDPDDRVAGVARLRALLATRVVDGMVDFPAAAWIWSARA